MIIEKQHIALLQYLVKGDIKAKYKSKMLGALWAVIDPLVLMLIYILLIKFIFQRGGEYYAAELLVGLVSYRWFSLTSMNASKVLVSNRKMLHTVRIPISVLPLSRVLINSVDFMVGFVLILALLFFFGLYPSVYWLWLPVLFALQFAFIYALAVIFAIIGVYFRDLTNVLQFGVRILLYGSPILYSISQIPDEFQLLYRFGSPLSTLIESYKNVLIFKTNPDAYFWVFGLYVIGLWSLAVYLQRSNKNLTKDL